MATEVTAIVGKPHDGDVGPTCTRKDDIMLTTRMRLFFLYVCMAVLLSLHNTQVESRTNSRDSSRFHDDYVHLFTPSLATGPVPILSGCAIAYDWRSPPRVHRHRAGSTQGSSSNDGCCLSRRHRGPSDSRLFFLTLTTATCTVDVCDAPGIRGWCAGLSLNFIELMPFSGKILLIHSRQREGPRDRKRVR